VVIDGTDNFPTRYLTNDAWVLLDKPERLWLDLSALKDRQPFLTTKAAPNYRDPSIPNRHHQGWFPPVPKAAF
jgi:adenylyltransferase/sulfurtransferase